MFLALPCFTYQFCMAAIFHVVALQGKRAVKVVSGQRNLKHCCTLISFETRYPQLVYISLSYLRWWAGRDLNKSLDWPVSDQVR